MCLAIPGQIVALGDEAGPLRTGLVDFGGVRKTVNLAFVPEANLNDYVLVHVGFALTRIDEHEARRVFEHLREISELGELAPP